jgi:chemotaxis protein MotB
MSASRRGGGRKRGAAGHAPENEERWLLTYSDMITLLMALFIVMWAISSVNISKFNQLKAALKSAFSAQVLPANSSILSGQQSPFQQNGAPIEPLNETNSPSNSSSSSPVVNVHSISAQIDQRIVSSLAVAAAQHEQASLSHIQQLVEHYAQTHGFAQDVSTYVNQEGLVVRLLTDKVLFASGQADVEPGAVPLLTEIAHLLSAPGITNPVSVQGNTDNQPIHSAEFPSNWELSSARADAVLQLLLTKGVSAARLSATGFGDVNPIASNATPYGRAKNRRVDILILRRTSG